MQEQCEPPLIRGKIKFVLILSQSILAILICFWGVSVLYPASKLHCLKKEICFSFDWNLEYGVVWQMGEKKPLIFVNLIYSVRSNKGMLVCKRRWTWSWKSQQTRQTVALPASPVPEQVPPVWWWLPDSANGPSRPIPTSSQKIKPPGQDQSQYQGGTRSSTGVSAA